MSSKRKSLQISTALTKYFASTHPVLSADHAYLFRFSPVFIYATQLLSLIEAVPEVRVAVFFSTKKQPWSLRAPDRSG